MANTNEMNFIEQNFDELNSQSTHKTFLGSEFLIWLWCFSEKNEGRFEVALTEGAKRSAQIWLDDRLVLTAKIGKSHEHTIKGGAPSMSEEAAISLKMGKAVKEIKISLEIQDEGLFTATLSGERLSPKGLKLPEPKDDREQTVVEQRIENVTMFSKALDSLYSKFMDERTDKLWDTKGINSIRDWIQSRNHDAAIIH